MCTTINFLILLFLIKLAPTPKEKKPCRPTTLGAQPRKHLLGSQADQEARGEMAGQVPVLLPKASIREFWRGKSEVGREARIVTGAQCFSMGRE